MATNLTRFCITMAAGAALAACWLRADDTPAAPSATGLKPGPAGIYCLVKVLEKPKGGTDLASDPCWTNPNVSGVILRGFWSAVEPVEGQFDFSYYEEGLKLAREHGKRLGVSITAGTCSPDWIYQAGATRFNFNKKSRDGATTPLLMPLPWDPVFQAKWKNLVAEFGRRFDPEPEVAYVAMGGIGRQMETFFVDSPGDIQEFDQSGGQQKWRDAGVTVAGFYAASFPHTHFLYAVGAPTPDTTGRATLAAMLDLLGTQYPGKFGVRSDGLRPNYGLEDATGKTIQRFASTSIGGFQMYLPFNNGKHSMNGTLQQSLDVGIHFGAQFIEVYRVDCFDPAQQSVLHDADQRLKAAAAAESKKP